MNTTCELDNPHMAEALHQLWERVDACKPVPTEITVELEDDNSITWTVNGLLKAAESCSVLLTDNSCQQYGLPFGSTYADLAEHIKETTKAEAECCFEILDDVPATFPKPKEKPSPPEVEREAMSDERLSGMARWEGKRFLAEPIYQDGIETEEYRIHRIRHGRTYCAIPSSQIPWDRVLPTKEAANEWVQSVLKEENQ